MITIRKLTKEDKKQLIDLMSSIEENISDKTWWLPLSANEEKILFDTTRVIIFGLFDDDKLVGASSLYLQQADFEEYTKYINGLTGKKTGKISRCMVLKQYRGNNYMYKLNQEIVSLAKTLNYDNLIVIVHPDNIASMKSLTKLGMTKAAYIVKENLFPRNILLLEIKN